MSMNIQQVSESLAVSIGSVRNWLKAEKKDFKSHVSKQGRQILIDEAGVKRLKEIKKQRFADAPPALLAAWKARKDNAAKATSGATKKAKPVKAAKAPRVAKAKNGNGHALVKGVSAPAVVAHVVDIASAIAVDAETGVVTFRGVLPAGAKLKELGDALEELSKAHVARKEAEAKVYALAVGEAN